MNPPAQRLPQQRPSVNPQPKISTPEAILLIFFAIIADLISLIPFINILSAIVTFFITQFYFRMKGLKTGVNMVMQLLEFIPILSVLPMATVGVVAVIVIDRFPRLVSSTVGAATALVPGGAVVAGAVENQLGVQRNAPQSGRANIPGSPQGTTAGAQAGTAPQKPQLAKSVPSPAKKAA
jgi:hypothetical protein